MTTITIEQVKNELELVRVILLGYPSSMARDDALRATEVISRSLAAPATAPDELERLRKDAERLREALTFYAQGDHFNFDSESWDTVSDEPQNFWCDEAGTATVEDGTIAKLALSAPATAPAQPAWHDAPNAPGDWVIVGKGFKSELQTGISQQEIDRVSSWPGRWYGPIPEDKP